MLSENRTHRKQDLWKLSKVDIRSPITANAWPVARVELEHGERGRVTDIASAPGVLLDGAFAAVSQMIGIAARVDSLWRCNILLQIPTNRLPTDRAQSGVSFLK